MNTLTILQGILIYALLAWKSYQLSQANHDLPLRCVVAVFACAGAAWPVSVAYSMHAVPGSAHWLMVAQPVLLLGCVFSLDLFFLFSLLPPSRARRHAMNLSIALGLLVACMVASAASVTSYTGMAGHPALGADAMYLLYNLGMAGVLADAWIWTRHGIPQADRTGARGLRISSWGIALMVLGVIPLAADVAVRTYGAAASPILDRIGGLLVFPGILVFLVGIGYPTFTDRRQALRDWRQHRRIYRDLGPLWQSLHEVFPEGTLPTRLPSSRWLEAVTPWQAKRRAVRRQLECRDGLVRISPYIRSQQEPSNTDLAERILDALHAINPSSLPPGKAMPIAVPTTAVPDTDIAADAAELVLLSRTIEAAQHAHVLPSATERIFSEVPGGRMKAVIIGGGIAGPAAAIALHKAGISSEIYEAYPAGADADTGAFLTITANGQDALNAIGVASQVADASFPTTRLRLFDASGTKLVDVPMGSGRPPSRTIRRSDLSHVLRAEAITRHVPILYGKRLVSVDSNPASGVTAHFEDGTSANGDLLIGADGTHSTVRKLIDPAAPVPRYTGLVIACGYTPALENSAGPDGYSMYYGTRAFLGSTRGPDKLYWWFARIPASEGEAVELLASGDPAQIARPFADDNTPASALIRESSPPLTLTESRDIAHLPTWSAKNMVVIGDAAHPMSPMTTQGASLAIEDATIMARCLRDVSPVPEALRVFEELRRERVEEIARSGSSAENPGPPTPGPRPGPRFSPMLDHHIEWEDPIRS